MNRARILLFAVALLLARPAAFAQPAGSPVAIPIDRFTIQSLAPEARGRQLTIPIDLPGGPATLMLDVYSVRAPGFTVFADDGSGRLRARPAPALTTYRGSIAESPGSRVTASVRAGQIEATIDRGDGLIVITPLSRFRPGAAPDQHLIYRAADSRTATGECGTPDRPAASPPPPSSVSSLGVKIVELACDADFEYYSLNGNSIDAVIADIESVTNGATFLYEQDTQVALQVGTVIVRTSEPDPYSTSNPYALLDQLEAYWKANHQDIHRDAVELFTGRDLDGTVIGISNIGGVCYADGYCLIQGRYNPEADRRYALSAHELAHCLGVHTHCDYDWDCRIMCSALGGCEGYHSFGSWAVGEIRDYADALPCLQDGEVELATTSVPFFDNFPQGPLNPARWMAVDGAKVSVASKNPPSLGTAAVVYEYQTFRSLPMALSSPANASFYTEARGVEAGKRLRVEYFRSSTGDWRLLTEIISDGSTQDQFVFREYTLPPDAAGPYFAIRFTGWGGFADGTDNWYVDDVRIEQMCYPDLNADGSLDLFDFLAFTNLFNANDPGADCTGDGVFDLFDFLCFLNTFNAGC